MATQRMNLFAVINDATRIAFSAINDATRIALATDKSAMRWARSGCGRAFGCPASLLASRAQMSRTVAAWPCEHDDCGLRQLSYAPSRSLGARGGAPPCRGPRRFGSLPRRRGELRRLRVRGECERAEGMRAVWEPRSLVGAQISDVVRHAFTDTADTSVPCLTRSDFSWNKNASEGGIMPCHGDVKLVIVPFSSERQTIHLVIASPQGQRWTLHWRPLWRLMRTRPSSPRWHCPQ